MQGATGLRPGIRFALAAGCVALLACSPGPRDGRVVVLGLDGLDPGVVDLMLSEGSLPNFAQLRRGGAYSPLESSRPLLSPIIWTTIATGKPPSEHRIAHFVAVNEKTGEELPVTSQMRRVKALWNILSERDREVGVVGWWATWPAEQVRGTIVSDHTCYHFLFEDGQTGARDTVGLVHPPEATADTLAKVRRPGSLGFDELRTFVDVGEEEFARAFEFEEALGHFKWALATAKSYERIGLDLWRDEQPDVLMVYIEGVDSTSHLFGHLFRAEGLKGDLAEQQRRFGSTVENMYHYADEIVGRYLDALDDDTTLVVLSDHGFELGALHDDPSVTRSMRRVSERFHRLHGILYLYGNRVRPGSRISAPTLLDIAPTVLALSGVEPAADMPGRVLDEVLDLPARGAGVATFETAPLGDADSDAAVATSDVDAAILEHLGALGYLDAASPKGGRNLAASAFQDGRLEEAAAAYEKLLADEPEESALLASYGGVLGALGRYDEALDVLGRALALEPLNAEAYHNRALIQERRGDYEAAVADYRNALRYRPGYEPSAAALVRLTGSAAAGGPSTPAQQLAYQLAQRAGEYARKGDFESALGELDRAETVAPRYAMVQQYRANVAFLMGDRDAARAALERALELEPDNALYRTNLERLAAEPPTRP